MEWTQPPEIELFAPIGVDTVLATPPGTYLELLEFYVDPVASAQVNAVARVTEEDTPALYILLRRTLTDIGLATYPAKTSYQRQRAQV